jgi:hypothetical protein
MNKLSTIARYLWISQCNTPYLGVKLSTPLTRSLRLAQQARARKAARGAGLTSLALLLLMPTAFASHEITPISHQSFALLLVKNTTQMQCLYKLYYQESRWNPKSSNNGHYGIPQGKSVWLKTANPYQQIEWGIKYNRARYGTMCKAYKHWRQYGWH